MTAARLTFGGALLVSLMSSGPATADATLTMDDGTVVQVRGGMARLNPADDSGYMQYDSARNVLIQVDPQEGIYMEIDQQALQQQAETVANMRARMAPQLEAMRAQLQQLPEAQRRMLEQQMGAMPGGAATGEPAAQPQAQVVKKGSRTVSGFKCSEYQVLENDAPAAEVCVAEAPGAGMSREDFDTLSAMMTFLRTMARQAADLAGGMGGGLDAELMVDVEGFPVQMSNHASGDEYAVAGVDNGSLSDEPFEAYLKLRKETLSGLTGQ